MCFSVESGATSSAYIPQGEICLITTSGVSPSQPGSDVGPVGEGGCGLAHSVEVVFGEDVQWSTATKRTVMCPETLTHAASAQ